MMNPKKAPTGFTLLELIITTLLLALIGMAIYSAFRNGVLVWQRAQQKGVKQEDFIIFTERLTKELRNSFTFTGIKFEGETNKISFPGLIAETYSTQPDELIPETPEKFYLQKPGQITYFWDEADKILKRSEKNYSEVFQNNPELPQRDMLKNINGLRLEYGQADEAQAGLVWLEQWDQADQFPQAVRIEIKWGKTENEQTITRTIFIPTVHQ